MKNKIYLLFTALTIIACGKKETTNTEEIIASKDITAIRAKKKELSSEIQSLETQIKQLSSAIEKIDLNKKVPLVTALKVKDTTFVHYIELLGNVETKENLVLTPEFSGILTNVYVKEGQFVKKGQLLAKIDDGGLSQQLAQLQIQTDLAKTTFERQGRLWEQNIGSEIQFLQAKANYEAQNQALNQLKKNISKTQVVAPFSGQIDDVITEKGSVVAAGQSPLIRIVNLSDMYITAEVPEKYLKNIQKNTDVKVYLAVIGTTLNSKVRQASNFINPVSRTFGIEVAVPNKNKTIKPNLTASLSINDYTNQAALLIPQSIISENAAGNQYVYKIAKNEQGETIATQQTITTGKTQGDLIEVTSGISKGDLLIVEGARSVKNNQTVAVLN